MQIIRRPSSTSGISPQSSIHKYTPPPISAQRTETVNDTFTPVWSGNRLDFVISDVGQMVTLEAWDEDVGKPDDLLGRVCFS